MRISLLVCFLCGFSLSYGQTDQIDSLKKRLRYETSADTSRAFDLNELAWQYLDYSIDSTARYAAKALALSAKIGYRNGIVDAKNTQGIVCRLRNETAKAIRLYEEVIRLRKQYGQEDRLTGAYSNLGSVYYDDGDNAKALKNYQYAFDNAVRFGQEENQLVLLNNIGVAYKGAGLYNQALDAFRKGLEMNKTFRNDYQEAQLYLNIATVYDQRKLFRKSVEYNLHAYRIFQRTDNIRMLSTVVYNLTIGTRESGDLAGAWRFIKEMEGIAKVLNEDDYSSILSQTKANYFIEARRYDHALTEVNRALQLVDSSSDLMQYAKLLLVKSDVLRYLKRYDESLEFADLGMAIVRRLDDPVELANTYMSKYEIYKAKGELKPALHYFEMAAELREKQAVNAVDNQIATLNSLNELDLKDKQIEISNKEREKVETENKRQAIQLGASLIIGLLVLILLVFSVRAYRLKQKANVLLSSRKQEIELQKVLIEEKQTEILDSIHYAKRIQTTLLAQESMIRRQLPESFIFFRPKDIVSGDFYWATELDNRFYLAVCDSTGHGVPGAFMSLLNISFLSEAINVRAIREPHEVLNYVRNRLIESVSQDGGQDGMDGVLLCFDRIAGTITYAASYNNPVIVTNGTPEEFPVDKMPIGKGEKPDSFTLHTISAVPGSMLYLYTDGYADQFGGEKGKKFKYRQLEELLAGHASETSETQLQVLEKTFVDWKGSLEQVDDVTIMGIRIS
jgi:serine phosphatase RsbU (regulator of sigma subunit)